MTPEELTAIEARHELASEGLGGWEGLQAEVDSAKDVPALLAALRASGAALTAERAAHEETRLERSLRRVLADLDTAVREHDERARAEGRASSRREAELQAREQVPLLISAADRSGYERAREDAAQKCDSIAWQLSQGGRDGKTVADLAAHIRSMPYRDGGGR